MSTAVVIPVHADPEGLAATLATLTGEPADVVVVVDGRHVETEQVAGRAGVTVVVLPVAGGSYAARNAGIDALGDHVDVVCFTDAGCLVQPGWVAAHRRALEGAELSGGAVEVTHGRRPTPAEWVDRCRNLRQEAYVTEGGYAATCNLAVRRQVIEAHRFDASLASGGDRELCLRATRSGFRLVYSPEAVVQHPARASAKAVLAKARRVGRGVARLPEESRTLPRRPKRPNRGLARRAKEAGLDVGPLWSLRVAWLDHRRARVLHDEAAQPQPVAGLHVVVLLASRWSSLQSMNTRWRRVVHAWSEHPDVAKVTVVDHPRFHPRARRLVRTETSWLPAVQLLDLTVPTTTRPRPLDRLAWLRAGRALSRALPEADRTLVVSTSSVSTPLLEWLRGPRTTVAFDAVDLWRNLAKEGPLGARLDAGYPAVRAAEVVTAVSAVIAEGMSRWTPCPVAVVPNGVALEEYGEPREAPEGLPEGPFAVYVGSLSSRLDVPFTAEVADMLKEDVTIVLAGPADPETAEEIARSSVLWLGPVSTDLVPGLLQRASVGLFPHRLTELTEAADSMKLLEYAAAGLPVVCTDLPGLPPEAVGTSDPVAFADAVRRGAAEPRDLAPRPWVRDRDWRVVADQLLQHLVGSRVEPAELGLAR